MSPKRPDLRHPLLLLVLLLLLSACATAQKPLTGIVPGREVETLQSSIGITMKSGGQGSGGRGYLVFRYPDRFHMAVLSPFGPTVLELFSDGERLTCLVPSKQVAYVGPIADLPVTGGLRTFGILTWVVERQPPRESAGAAAEYAGPSGDRVFYDRLGLLQRKESREGDVVEYSGYRNVDGVAFPEKLVIRTANGDRVQIVFDEPEINAPLEAAALTPNLDGYQVLPLAEFRGF